MTDNTADKTNREAAEALLSKVAYAQSADMDNLIADVLGSKVYRVGPGWEAEQLKEQKDITKVISATQLRDAMEEQGIQHIFIPKASALTMEMVERILKQSTHDKTLFWEAA